MDIKKNPDESSTDWLLRLDNGAVISFPTEQEARRAMAKIDTAKAVVATVQSLATATDSASNLEAEYFDIGNWVDADVETLGITAAQLASCLTLLQQINLLMTGGSTSPAIYRATLNQVRRVSV